MSTVQDRVWFIRFLRESLDDAVQRRDQRAFHQYVNHAWGAYMICGNKRHAAAFRKQATRSYGAEVKAADATAQPVPAADIARCIAHTPELRNALRRG